MRGRNPRGPFIWAVGAVLAGLAGCDNAPNPNFEQSIKDQQAARTRDQYGSLNSIPRSFRYLQYESTVRLAQASQMALSLRTAYGLMLQRLDAAPENAGSTDVFTKCRAAFAEVNALQTNASVEPQATPLAPTDIADRLNTCREHAIALEANADDELLTTTAALRRFASTGMVLAGVTMVSRGDEAAGLEVWRRGEALADEDKPGFKVTPNMFAR